MRDARGTAEPPLRRRLGVAIPTFNEADNLPPLLRRLDEALSKSSDVDARVLIIDDASPDGTGSVAERLAHEHGRPGLAVEVLHRAGKEGLGRAYTEGIRYLLDDDLDLVLQMDADLSHDPAHVPELLDAAYDSDFVVGSRYVPGGGTPDWSRLRRTVSRLGNLYTRAWLGSAISDYTGGFNLYSTDLLRTIDLDRLHSEGYGYLIELKYAAIGAGRGAREVPITFNDRQLGHSKIPRRTIVVNLLLVPALRLSAARRRRSVRSTAGRR